jgi:uncharacterized protein YjbI with pentapeptide repeats
MYTRKLFFITALLSISSLTSGLKFSALTNAFKKRKINEIPRTLVGVVTVSLGVYFGGPIGNAFASSDQIEYRLPPIDVSDPNRCELRSSSIGQANAARSKLYDLRQCNLKGQTGAGKDMSGAIMSEADFTGIDFKEAQLSKVYARNSKFSNCDFTDGVVDRVSFDGSDMKGAIFKNTVLSGTTFTNADLTDTDFTDSYIGPFDLKSLCANPTLKGTNPVTKADTKESAGCFE